MVRTKITFLSVILYYTRNVDIFKDVIKQQIENELVQSSMILRKYVHFCP